MGTELETNVYGAIADRIYACSITQCPLHARIGSPGCFPKFGAGGQTGVQLAVITMNPGTPDPAQARWTRQKLDRSAMHRLYEAGLVKYHKESRGGGLDIRDSVRAAGLEWTSVYYTEVGKCVTTKAEARDGTRARALATCSDEYLGDELEALLPSLRAVITLGGEAHVHSIRAMRRSTSLRRLVETGAVHPSPHPAAFGQRFRREFPAILASLKPLLGHTDASTR